jgi:protease-4
VDVELHNPKCAANHLGIWAVDPEWFVAAFAAVQSGAWPMVAVPGDDGQAPSYRTTEDGIAVIDIDGQITKGRSKFGGVSSVDVRRMIRAAANDAEVKASLLRVDSPGGTADGLHELATEIVRADARKPVYAHVEGSAASGAYWAASQARHVAASPMSMVGSIGAFTVVYDTSGRAAMDGIKVHVVSTGEFKGMGVPGSPVTEAQLEHIRERVNDVNAFFLNAVKTGRGFGDEIAEVADGRMWIAEKARGLKLVDSVRSLDDTFAAIRSELAFMARRQAAEKGLGAARRSGAAKALDEKLGSVV